MDEYYRVLASLSSDQRWKYEFWDRSSTEPAMIRFPLVVLFYLFLWGINLVLLEQSRLQYYVVLGIKSGHISYTFSTAIFFTILYILHLFFARGLFELTTEVSLVAFYILVFFACLSYFPGGENRAHFFRILKQIFFPGSVITFPEVLVADALCSMSKPLKDFGLTLFLFYAQIVRNGENPVVYHDTGMILIACLASLPFLLRIRQCSIQLFSASDYSVKLSVSLNILKYFSSFPPIWLAAAASLGYFHPLLPSLTAFLATINSIYSFLWDIIMDWGLFSLHSTPSPSLNSSSSSTSVSNTTLSPPSPTPVHRPRTIFTFSFHLLIACLNLLLRFSWAANRIAGLSSLPPSHLVLIVELAEVARRAVWNIFRIEWEINQHEKNMTFKDLSSKL